MKYIFVTGGVVSSLGKGLAAASLGTLLEHRGLKVILQKFDPYLNVDPGTMNPTSMAKCTCWMTGPKPTSTWATTSALPAPISPDLTT
nr:hypothetical protein [Verrucomicrobium spinosum]